MEKERKQCEEWFQNHNGDVYQHDNHSWVEIISNERIQTLRCEVCGKHSTGNIGGDIINT